MKAITPARDEMEKTELGHFPALDRRKAADGLRHCGRADLAAFSDEAHAERPVVAKARLGHLDVSLLENLERQRAAGKKHRAERKDEVLFACAHTASSRWRTSTLPWRVRKY